MISADFECFLHQKVSLPEIQEPVFRWTNVHPNIATVESQTSRSPLLSGKKRNSSPKKCDSNSEFALIIYTKIIVLNLFK